MHVQAHFEAGEDDVPRLARPNPLTNEIRRLGGNVIPSSNVIQNVTVEDFITINFAIKFWLVLQ